jgi:RibD C-terminal domain
MLREKGISYIVSGKSSVDLANAVNQLGEQFGIRTLLLEGSGRINGAFLQADLVDEPPGCPWHRWTPRHPCRLRRYEPFKKHSRSPQAQIR